MNLSIPPSKNYINTTYRDTTHWVSRLVSTPLKPSSSLLLPSSPFFVASSLHLFPQHLLLSDQDDVSRDSYILTDPNPLTQAVIRIFSIRTIAKLPFQRFLHRPRYSLGAHSRTVKIATVGDQSTDLLTCLPRKAVRLLPMQDLASSMACLQLLPLASSHAVGRGMEGARHWVERRVA